MIEYRTAGLADIDLLTETRMVVLRAVFGLPPGAEVAGLEEASREYYLRAFGEGRHHAVLAMDGGAVAGCGDASYTVIMPTPPSPGGHHAGIMNMYTAPVYRRQGIATRVLDLLVREAWRRGADQVRLDASQMGRPVYERYGFCPAQSEMILRRPPRAPAKGCRKMERALFPLAVHLLLVQNGRVLLLRRHNTGYEDGNYSVPAGHVDGGEDVYAAMQREALEEVGIAIPRESLRVVQVMHRRTPAQERVDYFFECADWQGTVHNAEPNKCDELLWAGPEELPGNTVGYVRAAIGFGGPASPLRCTGGGNSRNGNRPMPQQELKAPAIPGAA